MKKLVLAVLICILAAGLVFAQEEEVAKVEIAPFLPVSPRVMAQGGSFVSVAEGYEALFYNPAGFAKTKFDLTLMSMGLWMYMNPASINTFLESLPEEGAVLTEEEENQQIADMMTLINTQVSTGGIGIGMSTGAGLIIDGLGVGASMVVDAYLEGPGGMADASGDIIATLGGVAGYAMTFELLGMNLNVGADVRPMYRVHSRVENRDALEMVSLLLSNDMEGVLAAVNGTTALTGFGLGIDIGGILELGPLQVGLSIRDLFGTPFKYYSNTMESVMTALETGQDIPETEDTLVTDVKYYIPMNISAGVALNIDFLKPLLDLTVHGDLQDVIGVVKYKRSPWTLINIGAEAKLLKLIRARAGFNQGYITMGAGIHLLILDVNAAFFTREKGKYIGDQPNSGITLEVALRI